MHRANTSTEIIDLLSINSYIQFVTSDPWNRDEPELWTEFILRQQPTEWLRKLKYLSEAGFFLEAL